VHTALELIEGAGRELAIDANVWVDHLYDLIGRMGASAAEVGPKELRVLLSAMRTAFIKRKEFGTERVAAFAKRLSVLALQLAPHVALGAIAFTRALMQVGGCACDWGEGGDGGGVRRRRGVRVGGMGCRRGVSVCVMPCVCVVAALFVHDPPPIPVGAALICACQ
jgi:hypothetical protein